MIKLQLLIDSSKTQYEAHLKDWGFPKNRLNSRELWISIGAHYRARKARGLKTEVYINGNLQLKGTVQKEISRYRPPTRLAHRRRPVPPATSSGQLSNNWVVEEPLPPLPSNVVLRSPVNPADNARGQDAETALEGPLSSYRQINIDRLPSYQFTTFVACMYSALTSSIWIRLKTLLTYI